MEREKRNYLPTCTFDETQLDVCGQIGERWWFAYSDSDNLRVRIPLSDHKAPQAHHLLKKCCLTVIALILLIGVVQSDGGGLRGGIDSHSQT